MNYVSIGVLAWNEESAIGPMLETLFNQSLFRRLASRNFRSEVLCVANGCTDRTTAVAAECFRQQQVIHPGAHAFSCKVVDLAQRGKLNAWNEFVHRQSCSEARYLFLMDADILLHDREALWSMLTMLEKDPDAHVAVDRPCKDILFKSKLSLGERLSLATSEMTTAADAQLCAQLYCIRAQVARRIYLPKDLPACEDGFIKQVVSTDFLTHPVAPERIRLADGASHTFEAYKSPLAIFRNQKRQIMGQTLVHILMDKYLKELSAEERLQLARTLREKEQHDPLWLKRLIAEHLQRQKFCWRLYPGLVTHRLRSLSKLAGWRRWRCIPAAAVATVVTLVASYFAYRSLNAGSTDYWPRAPRVGKKDAVLSRLPRVHWQGNASTWSASNSS